MDIGESIKALSYIKNEVHNKQGRLLNAYVSGSDMYGWRSKDSDVDIRGIYVLNKEEFLGLKTPREVIELRGLPEMDITLFEIKKAAQLALKGNCNVVEEFYADQLFNEASYLDFRALIQESWGKKGMYNSYKGLATFNYKKFILKPKTPERTVKKYLYVFRGLLAGRYAMDNGMVEPNIETLYKYYRVPVIKPLLQAKRKGLEHGSIPDSLNTGELDEAIINQFKKLDEAYLKSELPEGPSDEQVAKVNKAIVKMRLSDLIL